MKIKDLAEMMLAGDLGYTPVDDAVVVARSYLSVVKRLAKCREQVKLLTFEPVLEKLLAQNEALQEQVKEYDKALTNLAISPSPVGKYWKDYATDELIRIKAMGEK